MVDYEHSDLFMEDSVEKQVTISYGNTVITNEDLFNQEMTLEESLCSDSQLTFGSCEASVIKFKVANIVAPVKNQWLTVRMALDGNNDNPFTLGTYKVESDKPTADRKWREIVAYDALYDIINADVIDWYNKAFSNAGSTMTVKQFRHSFFEHFGIKEADTSLINDNEVIGKTWKSEELSGKTVVTAICEINGCFGHIGRDGIFHYIYLVQGMQGLFPANNIFPADDLYPRDPKTTPIPKNLYISCTYEDFTTRDIGKVQIINGDSGTVSTAGSGDNCYTIESNFLVANKTQAELDRIAERILGKVRGVTYRPFDAECLGNPCFEVGDPVRLSTTYDIVETYILKRTLTGIQALKDSYSSDGVEKYELKVNSTERAIGQLSDKTDSLEEDVETINEDIEEINENIGGLNISLQKTEMGLQAEVSRAQTAEGDLSSRITMTESDITAEVTRAKSEENILSGRITLTAEQLQTSLTNTANGLQSQITQTASDITAEVTRAKDAENTLSGKITLTAEQFQTEITNTESNLQSQITQTANSISQKVSKGDVVSEINQTSDTIHLRAGHVVVTGGNLTIDSYGNGKFSGELEGVTGTFETLTGKYGHMYFYDHPESVRAYINGRMEVIGELRADYINTEDIVSYSDNGIQIRSNGTGEIKIYGKGHTRIHVEKGGYWAGVAMTANSSNKFHFRPEQNGIIDCGSTSYHWDNVYADNGTIITSDRNEKMNIMDMTESYAEQMIDGSIPKTYMMVNGSSGRTHNGMLAQDVEQQLYSMGLTTMDFAGLVIYNKDVDGVNTGELGYGLRYEEYIPILIKYAQGLKRRVCEAEMQAANMQNMFFNLQGEFLMLKQQIGG